MSDWETYEEWAANEPVFTQDELDRTVKRYRDLERAKWVAWLVDMVAFPFDFSFDTPPPVDPGVVAEYWRESDDWDCSPEEAEAMVREEGWPVIPKRGGGVA